MAGRVLFPGLKPGQRKVLFTCLKRNDKREVKVAQLAGSVAEMSAYHHGEVQSAWCVSPVILRSRLSQRRMKTCSRWCSYYKLLTPTVFLHAWL